MIGASQLSKKNIRRTGVPATIAGEPNPIFAGLPTDERLAKAGTDFSLGGEDRGVRTYVMRDSPLDRAHKKHILSGPEHSALQKYRHHWYHAGQAPIIGSIDLSRIFSGDGGSMAGMPKTENQVFHRDRWREAQRTLGLRSSSIVDKFVCEERTLEQCGADMGWMNKPQAIAAAAEIVRDAGYRLSKLWGIG